jgi:hypothetical protein
VTVEPEREAEVLAFPAFDTDPALPAFAALAALVEVLEGDNEAAKNELDPALA